ncbi:MAG: hypothetical protein LBV19_11050 [Streptococcaceae bacterium]|nr:hypothetical protein [Streptococcaceae bacterium]
MKKVEMKKLLIISVIFLLSVGLTGCENSATPESSSSAKKIKSASSTTDARHAASSSNKSNASTDVPSSSKTIRTEEGSQTDLAQARTALYQAGINTASFSDEQILEWWQAAKNQDLDFVAYAQKQMQ